ncbi:MAG TPA: hypothetical protein PKY59_12640 [Pyrinomonadaceae bacterium]|nr:hypothetical protein [Pyrinomonadaceae bacterium]
MGTHATIIKKEENVRTGTVFFKAIGLNYDGNIGHAGVILAKHYQEEETVNELFDLGNLSILEKDPDRCIAYGRDRQRLNQEAIIRRSIEDIEKEYFTYLWQDEQWFVRLGDGEFIELEEKL